VSTAILFFTKTNSGGTDHVWFYDMHADGYSLDDKRQPLLPEDKLGVVPRHSREGGNPALTPADHEKNNLPDVLARWRSLLPLPQGEGGGEGPSPELTRPRTDQSFCVPKADIAANGYDLSINRYKEVVHAQVQHRAPQEILAELAKLEEEIAAGMKALEGMLK
jgi:type I restriction enzyme M protein